LTTNVQFSHPSLVPRKRLCQSRAWTGSRHLELEEDSWYPQTGPRPV
jgi:hypothetical protein